MRWKASSTSRPPPSRLRRCTSPPCPPDANHPYGHDKAEFFAAVIEGVLIVIAALSIFRARLGQLRHRPASTRHAAARALALNAVATVLNAVWSGVLIRAGRALRSPALVADGRHLLADVVTSVGIAAGVGLAVLTGYLLLDPMLAAATGVYVLWSGMRDDFAFGRRPDGCGAGAGGDRPHPRTGGGERRGRAGGARPAHAPCRAADVSWSFTWWCRAP